MKISISMITLNEEKNIARALSSCTFADEIVVVDGGSTDGTLDILRSHEKVSLIQHTWEGHFGKQRQISLDNCTGDWVVRLDADEAFSQLLEENIRAVLESTPPDIFGYYIRQCNLIEDENYYSKGADDYENMPRIWRNLKIAKWEGRVHEELRGFEGRLAKHWDAYVVHYGFLDKERFWKKSEQYSQIEESGFNTPEELVYREYDVQFRPSGSKVSSWVPPYPSGKSSELPRVAILRGPNLNLWEMQNYEPLCKSFDITSYTTTQPSFDISHITLPVVKLPPNPQNPAYMMGLEAELLDKDIIYTADITWIFTYQAAMMKQKFGNRIIALEWENIPFAYEEDEQMREMKRFNRQMVDHFVAVTERARDALIIEGVPEDKITVIPMGIDVNRFRPDDEARWRLRKEFGIGKEERVVLFTGRLVWEKGIYDLLYAAKLVTREDSVRNIHLRFVVIGKGSESSGIKSRVEELGVGSVFTFIEDYPYHKMHEMYNMADIFVLPSISTRTWKEQFGMVLIEAMACGLPVISTLSGSIPEVVGDAGIIVQSNDPGDLSTAIMKLLKDDTLKKELSIKGRERALNEFNSQKIAQKFNLLFEEVVKSSFRGAVQELASYTGVDVDEVISRIRGVYAQPIQVWGGLSNGMLTQEKVNEFYINTDSYLFDLVQYNYENPMYMQGIDEITRFCRRVSSERGKLNILDFGGGIGSQIINLSRISGIRLNYADIPGKTFNYAKWRFGRRRLDVNMIDACKDDFLGSNRFDVVIMLDVVEHLVEPEKTVKYLIEHINTNGYLIMFASFFNNNGEAGWHLNVERYTNEGFYSIVKEMGLEMLNNAPLRFFRKTFEESTDLVAEIDATIAKGRLAEARGLIESYLEMHPLVLSMLVKYAEVCFKLNDYNTASDSLEKVLLFNKDAAGAVELKRKIESYVSM
jgi:glycosyltransferase involved in cell wall biosynthesis/SAM-dependent methyltransferase